MAKSYRELEQELNTILERIENGSYDELDQLLADYDAGKKCIEQLEKRLEIAQTSIKKVTTKK